MTDLCAFSQELTCALVHVVALHERGGKVCEGLDHLLVTAQLLQQHYQCSLELPVQRHL